MRLCAHPSPSKNECVAILDEAFDAIAKATAKADKNLLNSRAVFEAELRSIFSKQSDHWDEAALGEVVRFIDYRGKTPAKTSDGLRLITAKNVKMGRLQDTPREFVAPETYGAWMTRGIPRRGDVLFTTEAPLANVAQLDTNDQVVFAQRIIIMQPVPSRLGGAFLKYLLLSDPVQRRIHAEGTGATVKGIKASLLKLVRISFPVSLAEQAEIVSRFDALDGDTRHLASICQRKLALLA